MDQRRLGRSGLHVSSLAFGAMTFGGEGYFEKVGTTGQEEADRLVAAALDAGVTLFDTADIYSTGRSEEILGRALGPRRKHVVLATKAFARMGPAAHDAGLSRRHLIEACDSSLRRLGTDWIDLYQLHGQDMLTPTEETLRALDDLVRAGKVRYIGCSNFSGWTLARAVGVSDRLGLPRFIGQQIYYSLLARDAEWELLPAALGEEIGVLVWSPLSQGLLSGKYRRGEPPPAGARVAELGPPGTLDETRLYRVVDALVAVAAERNARPAQVALAWVLSRPGVTSAIVGARDAAQLTENLAAAQLRLRPDEIAALDAASQVPEPYPYWHQHLWGAERNPPLAPPQPEAMQ